ncbi:hypothetical protein VTP01DRAFT_5995 [Rhizomucor pusillus]|uniref:uncharacterized protein n=1 Tax=Rhizomucor pusillus TaxID=4840 RepID=UPI0037420471
MDFYNNHHAINNNNNHNGYNDASNLYYADPLNYGPAYGYSISSFMANRYVRLSWAAFFALWVYWGLLWFLRHAFGDGHQGPGYPTRQQQDESIEAAEGAAAHQPTATRGGWIGWMRRPRVAHTHSRLSRASDVLRDLVLMLLSVLIPNTVGRGSTRPVMILSWIYFGFAVFWSIFEAARESHIARFIYAAIFYGIALAIAGLAFRRGFDEFYAM